MRYSLMVGLSFLLYGCGLDCRCPEYEAETLLLGADIQGASVTALMLDWKHSENERRSPLDCSCPRPGSKAIARRYSGAGTELRSDEFPRIGAHFTGAIQAVQVHGDTTTYAAFNFYWDGSNEGLAPVIISLNAAQDLIQYMELTEQLFVLIDDGLDLSYKQTRIHAATDGAFLFIGPATGGGTRLSKVSTSGELLWSDESGSDSLLLNAYYPLANGEFVAISGGSGAKLIGPDGGTTATLVANVFGAPYFPYSAANFGDTAIVLAGSVPSANGNSDAFVYILERNGSFIDSFRVQVAGCQDSVHVLYSEATDELVLVCRSRPQCGEAVMIEVFRLTREGELLAETGLNHYDRTYLTGADLFHDGRVLIAATSNSGRNDRKHYGKLIALYTDLAIHWEKTIGP